MGKTLLVGIHEELAPGEALVAKVEENAHGLDGYAIGIYHVASSTRLGFVFQKEEYKQDPSWLSIADISAMFDTEDYKALEFACSVEEAVKIPGLRGKAYVLNCDIPTTQNTKEKKGRKVTMAKGKTTATTGEVLEEYIVSITGSTKKGAGNAPVYPHRYAAGVVQAGKADPSAPDGIYVLPITLELDRTSGYIVAKAKELEVKETGTGKDVLMRDVPIGHIFDDEETTIQLGDLEKKLRAGQPYTAHVFANSALITLRAKILFQPSQEKQETAAKLNSLGLTKSIISQKESYLKKCGFSDDDILLFWKDYQLFHKDCAPENPGTGKLEYIDKKGTIIKKMTRKFFMGFPILAIGAPSTGKDCCMRTLAALFDMPIIRMNVNGGTDADTLIGDIGITNDNGVGVTGFQASPLVQAMETPCLFVIDEVNCINPDQLITLNEALEWDADMDAMDGMREFAAKMVKLPRGGDIKIHPMFRIAFTMNMDLAGTKAMNDSFKNRSSVVHFEQGDITMAEILSFKFPTLKAVDSKICQTLWTAILNEARNNGAGDVEEIGVRNFEKAAALVVRYGMTMKEALTWEVIDNIGIEDSRRSAEAILNSATR